jgi:hypothetical protein
MEHSDRSSFMSCHSRHTLPNELLPPHVIASAEAARERASLILTSSQQAEPQSGFFVEGCAGVAAALNVGWCLEDEGFSLRLKVATRGGSEMVVRRKVMKGESESEVMLSRCSRRLRIAQ